MPILALVILLALALPASAATCMPPAAMLRALAGTYGEFPTHAAVAEDHRVLLTVSADGSWTLLAEYPGALCVVASGEDWRAVDTLPRKLPAPAEDREAKARSPP